MSDLRLVPVSLRDANAFVAEHHRYSNPTQGHKFSVAVASGPEFVDVAPADRKPALVTARARKAGTIERDDVAVVVASTS